MAELLPCPFCGEVACQIFDVWTETYKYGCLTSRCIGSVHNQTFSFKTDAQAIKAWNTRTPKETHSCDSEHTETHDNTSEGGKLNDR